MYNIIFNSETPKFSQVDLNKYKEFAENQGTKEILDTLIKFENETIKTRI